MKTVSRFMYRNPVAASLIAAIITVAIRVWAGTLAVYYLIESVGGDASYKTAFIIAVGISVAFQSSKQ